MKISFDLDSTLIPNGNEFETEKRSVFAKLLGIEELRKGTRELIFELKSQGNKILIYTTSFRTKNKIKRTFKYYGIKVDRIINQTENQRELKARNISSSKFPPAFGIDIHIDDSKGVGIESKHLNFKAIIIDPSDNNWTEKIKNGLKKALYFKILKRLFDELWLQSNNCTEPIENMWFSLSETVKSTGIRKKEVIKFLDLLVEQNILKLISDKPQLYEFTDIGRQIKSDLDIRKIIINVG